jgi:hypothetical protein
MRISDRGLKAQRYWLSIRDPKFALLNFSSTGLLYRAACRIVVEAIEIKTWGRERGVANQFRDN